ncbi:MAG: histidine--tRNA ligase [Planctomycetota bacterium]|nr:histidine--tRNA ligase [Planctomycetota bacterium]
MTVIRGIEGTRDYFGADAVRFNRALQTAAEMFGRYGYSQIITPLFEATSLFARSLGEATDIVSKEMYTFTPGSETITLRPEGTAGVIRAILQHEIYKNAGLIKFWYAGAMFRRERPQKGRQRQFHQVGVEAVGSADPLLDVEVIALGMRYYEALGLRDVRLRLNTIGCLAERCRPAYRQRLRQALQPLLPHLCKTCQERFERNILRILDCKNRTCQEVVANAPRAPEQVCEACRAHFAVVCEALEAQGISYDLDHSLVRGLDYYTKTVFEYTHAALGAQDAIGGGGRYDGLMQLLGGPDIPAVGFALGVERIMIALAALPESGDSQRADLDIYGVALGVESRKAMAKLVGELRQAGWSADMDYESRSLKAQLRVANKRGARLALILGDDELRQGKVIIKDLGHSGEQRDVLLGHCVQEIKRALNCV